MQNANPKSRAFRGAQRGYALFVAIIVASIVLTIGLGITNIVTKEIVLSSFGRESQFAFYAADAGTECAFYWDINQNDQFATSSASSPPSAGVTCNGQDIAAQPWVITSTPTSATTTFSLSFTDGSCVTVKVGKWGGGLNTNVESHGYNTCNINNPERVERTLLFHY